MLTVRREQFRYMKNKYLTRFLCLTLMSGMVLSGPASVLAAEDTAAYTADGSDFSDSGDFDSGSEDPAPDTCTGRSDTNRSDTNTCRANTCTGRSDSDTNRSDSDTCESYTNTVFTDYEGSPGCDRQNQ